MAKIYSGFFIGNKHTTYEFNPGKCTLPEWVKEGDNVKVKVVGKYEDAEIKAVKVEVILPDGTVLTHQPSGTPLHITVAAKVPPVQSGIRIAEYGATPIAPYFIKATAGFFRA